MLTLIKKHDKVYTNAKISYITIYFYKYNITLLKNICQ